MLPRLCIKCQHVLNTRLVNVETVDYWCPNSKCPRFGIITVAFLEITVEETHKEEHHNEPHFKTF